MIYLIRVILLILLSFPIINFPFVWGCPSGVSRSEVFDLKESLSETPMSFEISWQKSRKSKIIRTHDYDHFSSPEKEVVFQLDLLT